MNRPAMRPVSQIVASLHTVAPPKKPIAEEARLVREFVSENLLLARMCMETGYISDRALGSLITGLRIVRTAAESIGDERIIRIIEGASVPAENIVARFKDGVTRAQRMELAAISAAIEVSLDELPQIPDVPLLLAYDLSRLHRMQAEKMSKELAAQRQEATA